MIILSYIIGINEAFFGLVSYFMTPVIPQLGGGFKDFFFTHI